MEARGCRAWRAASKVARHLMYIPLFNVEESTQRTYRARRAAANIKFQKAFTLLRYQTGNFGKCKGASAACNFFSYDASRCKGINNFIKDGIFQTNIPRMTCRALRAAPLTLLKSRHKRKIDGARGARHLLTQNTYTVLVALRRYQSKRDRIRGICATLAMAACCTDI